MGNTRNTRWTSAIVAAGAGALVMYLFDREQGPRRIALARDRIGRLARSSRATADAGLRDLANRAKGMVAKARGALRNERPSEEMLVARVRARLGRLVSNPQAIQVSASGGRVTLRGQLPESEEDPLLSGVERVRGVDLVESRLELHETADDTLGLQGSGSPPRPRMEFMQRHWAPGPRLAALAFGGALTGYGAVRRGPPGMLLGAVGALLVARAASNTKPGRQE
jgi:hypothetical protein